jgi:UDP-N-acetylmuramate dehydrogenase
MAGTPSMQWDLATWLRAVPTRPRLHCPLAPYTSMRVGGPADALVHVDNTETLQAVHALCQEHQVPVFVLGGGSNLLIRDGGIRGVVLVMRGAFRRYRLEPQGAAVAHVQVGVGYSFSRLALEMARQGWSGLEFAYGIPGTVGGAMIMNAGTNLGDLSRVLVSARMLLRDGQVQELPASALGLRYRGSSYPAGAILLDATLRLELGDPQSMEALIRQSYKQRQQTQPLWLPNAGSIFKNPPGAAAGRLIESLGLKGTRRGGAEVSPVHANFIVNVEQATAADVEALIAHIRGCVAQHYATTLEPEVHIVGEEV